jgi:multisubunit Na+/H+ antiporter MnhF subunit
VIINISLVALTVAAVLFGYRMLVGPTLADRVNALNGLLVVGSSAVAADAVRTERGSFLTVVVVAALVGFVGSSMVARFIESRGR